MPSISICIIAFNGSKYINRCLDSIHAQTLPPYEVIFIDDCSTDSTYQIAKSYASKLPQLKVFRLEKNSGVGKARNIAINKANGDYIWAIDCDDTIPTNALKVFSDALDKYNSEVIAGAVNILSYNGGIIHTFAPNCEHYNITPINHPHLSLYTSGYHVSMIIKKSLLKNNNISYGEGRVASADGIFLFSLVRKIKRMTILKTQVYNYYIENIGSVSKNRGITFYKDDLYAWSVLIQNISTEAEEDYAAARIYHRVEEFFSHDIKIYLSKYSDSDIKIVINFFIKYLAHKNVCNKIITLLLEKGFLGYKMATFMICIKNSDLSSAFKIVKLEIANNNLDKKRYLFSKILKKIYYKFK